MKLSFSCLLCLGAQASVLACGGPAPGGAPLALPSSAEPVTVSPVASPAPSATAPVVAKGPEDNAAVLAPLPGAACVVAGSAVRLPGAGIPLTAGGSIFFTAYAADRMEARLDAARGTVTVSTATYELTGEVATGDVGVAPKGGALVAGYIRVHNARIRALIGDRAELATSLPRGVDPVAPPRVELPCSALSFGRAISDPTFATAIQLRVGASVPFSLTPGGSAVATVKIDRPQSTPIPGHPGLATSPALDNVFETGRKGANVQVAIQGVGTTVEGWIPASAVVRSPQSGALFDVVGALDGASTAKSFVCPTEVPIYVRVDEAITKVGSYKAKARIVTGPTDRDTRAGEVPVALGEAGFGGLGFLGGFGTGPRPRFTTPYVRASAVEGCAKTQAR